MNILENAHFRLQIDPAHGAVRSLVVKSMNCELIGEPRLLANFRLCMPLEDYQCNYIDGMAHAAKSITQSADHVTVQFAGVGSVDLEYTIALVDDTIRFRAKLTNHAPEPISEFWFPRLGGWTQFGAGRDAKVAVPGYVRCNDKLDIFRKFPGTQNLGSEHAEWFIDYPGIIMPWTDIYDAESDTGLYFGYHDTTYRCSSWHWYLHPRDTGRVDSWFKPDEVDGAPVGLTFSHVRYPFIKNGETFDTGEFILRVHKGDWHAGSQFYRQWFLEHFPFDKSKSWLRKKSAWFSSIIYQPEDRLVADYPTYDQWCCDAEKAGIDTFELIGWDKGGLERDYPDYVPEPKLGGRDAFRKLMKSIDERGSKCLAFVNYNILDQNTDWYKRELHQYTHQDLFGSTPNWMTWGESTLLARKGYARKHVMSSVVPGLQKILEDRFLEVVKDGAHGFQIDKLCLKHLLDFNPLNTRKPDEALCEGLVEAIAELFAKCRQINPDFCIASESVHDRVLPYVDVFYRCSHENNISPLRYVFPEWTSCQHISGPFDFRGVNGAMLTGSVICVEPFNYQGSLGHPLYRQLAEYIKEVECIRHELADIIFLGAYHDTLDAEVILASATNAIVAASRAMGSEVIIADGDAGAGAITGKLVFRVHGHRETDRRAIVVSNQTDTELRYRWRFTHREVRQATVYEPFQKPRPAGAELRIKGEGLQIIVEQ